MEEQKKGCSQEEDGENDVGDLMEHANRELVNARPSNLEIDTHRKHYKLCLFINCRSRQ